MSTVATTASDDTEITLGVGKLLGLFFLLAAICGVFFSIGYSLGRGAGHDQAVNDQPQVTSTSDSSAKTGDGNKPSAAVQAKQDTQTASNDTAAQTSLTFYKAVQQNSPGETAPAEKHSAPKPAEPPALVKTSAASPATEGPSSRVSSSPATGPGTIVVQIAALTREDDAVSLAGALRKKNYNVFVVNNPAMNDKFYHVQVGPFVNAADAQAMKAKLVAEGYNPIIKK